MAKDSTENNQKAQPQQNQPQQNQGGNSKGVLIGCVIGCVVITIIIAIIALFVGCSVFKWGTGYKYPDAPSSSGQSQSDLDRAADEAIENAQ